MTERPEETRVRLAYLYRDGSNYKQHGSVVLGNPDGVPLDQAAARLRAACVHDDSFNASQVGLPDLYFDDGIDDDDHSWHEFTGLETTLDAPTDRRSLRQLIDAFERGMQQGWRIDEERLSGA